MKKYNVQIQNMWGVWVDTFTFTKKSDAKEYAKSRVLKTRIIKEV